MGNRLCGERATSRYAALRLFAPARPTTLAQSKRWALRVRLLERVPLLVPRISPHVVAVALPEAGAVAVGEFEAAEPLGAFPEVEVGDDETERAAVVGGQRLAVVVGSQEDVVAVEVRQRQVGGE